MADEKSAESENAPIIISTDDPYVGVNEEYRNSPDELGKPMFSDDADTKAIHEAAIDDEKAGVVPATVYGAGPSEVDSDGNKIEVKRMGDKPDKGEEPASAYGDEDADKGVLSSQRTEGDSGTPLNTAPTPATSSPKPTP